jgi:hypothetical protein
MRLHKSLRVRGAGAEGKGRRCSRHGWRISRHHGNGPLPGVPNGNGTGRIVEAGRKPPRGKRSRSVRDR